MGELKYLQSVTDKVSANIATVWSARLVEIQVAIFFAVLGVILEKLY